jgi:riboflavin synthase
MEQWRSSVHRSNSSLPDSFNTIFIIQDMFTGIIEAMGTVVNLQQEGTNVRLTVQTPLAPELKVDQSVAHNGVCLTVVHVAGDTYEVVAIEETLKRTAIGHWGKGERVNLERCLKVGDRFDGHIVQGHVDATATVTEVISKEGSWLFHFQYQKQEGHITVPKGSICVNGVSLTVVDSGEDSFSVAIIPYTFEHTCFSTLKTGDTVNLEFDVLGKYVAKMLAQRA